MIPDIQNPFWRRVTLVFTVASIIVCIGPARLIVAVLRWVETEFETDLRAVWRGDQPKKEIK
jgi:hypothetical protein